MSSDADLLPDDDEVARRLAELRERMSDGRTHLIADSSGGLSGEPVVLSPPQNTWATEFLKIRDQLAHALGPRVRVEHVGSTSIPGIHAKPVIDVQVSVPDITDEAAFVSQIESVGVRLRAREPDVGHLYFRREPRTLQIHVCEIGSKWERDHLLFRDYLRAHPDEARAYEELKLAAVARYGLERLAYTESKGPFVEGALARAETWAAENGWTP
jgi:GrpB-like predicted nucleotidyltransferase (UPF0157 family)